MKVVLGKPDLSAEENMKVVASYITSMTARQEVAAAGTATRRAALQGHGWGKHLLAETMTLLKLFHCIVSERGCLYVPLGFVFAERVMGYVAASLNIHPCQCAGGDAVLSP